ncbi:MAG: hypothetical protein R3240_08255, partial [Gammaproteobacteria bacterium]|nr:hypothetical protein [Gammaproteobacteria bacterium]
MSIAYRFNLNLRAMTSGPALWGKVVNLLVLWRQMLFLLVLGFGLIACSDNSANSNAASPAANDLELSSSKVYLSEVNSQYSVSAVYVDGSGVAYIEQPEILWQSSDANVVTVNSAGVITAIGMGEAKVQVSANGINKAIDVIVSANVGTVSGQLRYEDREYDGGGFNIKSNYFKAIRFAKVDLMSAEGQVLQTTYSDEQGNFSFSGIFNSQQTISVYSITNSNAGLNLQVQDRSGYLYAATATIDLNNTGMQINVPLSSPAAGAFNVLDVLTSAAQFTLNYTSLNLVSLTAFWENNNFDGTYYCNGYDSYYCKQGQGIYVYNETGGDTDEFDDDVLYHEFGHFFMDTLSRDDSLGGCHLLSSKDLDLRLAWSEGVGDFFPAAVKYWLSLDTNRAQLLSSAAGVSSTAYIDTYRTSAQISIALNALDTSRYSTAANELAIAKILYDLYLQHGMPSLVQVFSQYFPGVSTPVNLEAFWDGWAQVHNPAETDLANLRNIFNARQVFYQDDQYEDDDLLTLTRAPITKNVNESHYLYKPAGTGVDVDVVPFTVTAGLQYTIKTLNLSGGTDTYIN